MGIPARGTKTARRVSSAGCFNILEQHFGTASFGALEQTRPRFSCRRKDSGRFSRYGNGGGE